MTQDDRLVITLTGEAAARTRKLAADLDLTAAEAVRRGVGLLETVTGLGEGEELLVRDGDGKVEGLRLVWPIG